METLKEMDIKVNSIVTLIEAVRTLSNHGTNYSTHRLSSAVIGDNWPCTDCEMAAFVKSLLDGVPKAKLTIGYIEWEESGNCVGDNLYPSWIKATKLPDDRYFLEVS